ncbi:(2Fe-2S)-binding protein [Plectonema radiosum NIES-515]|uniref:(2Fe-2S)-binding protein n=1 Tax=Plectonema radiosum NIES-515 TaxID=2986073 RepID=A0ABT3AS51_9CYAN|nr:(2Fe-2S)-binding protein [Plectonema radiosum]MCV3211946.1 (2Fe-2S)-binding protein [Plectonema radiosum NIES-515]
MPNVLIKPSGELIELPRNSVLTILEEVNETIIPFGCRAGACGVCVIEVLEGIPNLTDANYIERGFLTTLGYPEERYRLACQCRLQGDVTIRQIGS